MKNRAHVGYTYERREAIGNLTHAGYTYERRAKSKLVLVEQSLSAGEMRGKRKAVDGELLIGYRIYHVTSVSTSSPSRRNTAIMISAHC